MQSSRPRRRRTRLWLLPLVALLSVVTADVLFTTAARAAGLYEPPILRERTFRRPNPVYHHGLRPNVDRLPASWGPRDYLVSTNSLGFKDAAPREVALRAAGPRVLLIGDSFTEGIGVTYGDTFAGILARELAPAGVEVLNAAAVSYAPSIYFRKVRHLVEEVGLEFDRLVVGIDLSDIVDEVRHYPVGPDEPLVPDAGEVDDRLKELVKSNTILLRLLGDVWRGVREGGAEQRQALGLRNALWTSDPELFEAYGREGLRRATANMDRLHALCRRHDIALTVFVYPWPDQIVRHEVDCVQRTHWRDWAREHGAGFVDCFPLFLDSGEPDEVLRRDYIPGDMHWNEAGHARVAARLLEALR